MIPSTGGDIEPPEEVGRRRSSRRPGNQYPGKREVGKCLRFLSVRLNETQKEALNSLNEPTTQSGRSDTPHHPLVDLLICATVQHYSGTLCESILIGLPLPTLQ